MASSRLPRVMSALRGLPRLMSRRCRYATQANDIEGMLAHKSKWESFPDPIRKLAVFAEHARAHNYQIPLLSKAQQTGRNGTNNPGAFTQEKAYHITAAIRQLREMNGEVVAGRKIGFTNQNIWQEYMVDTPNWSYMYEHTIVDLPGPGDLAEGKGVLADIRHLNAMEPRIEPEIIFGLKSVPKSDMSDLEILGCLEWMAHGFEIVASVYPHWKFTAADTTAAFALHGLLLVGPRHRLRGKQDAALLSQLQDFKVDMLRNGEKVDEGKGSNVLGSPIAALRRLVELLEKDEVNQPLQPGEVVTTGTLTKAIPIENDDMWSTKISGIDLPGVDVKFRTE
ncbi:Putative fumarylacetoacetase-like domain superfamily [Septoria linicola]|uniref:Fumarylacetoacetase-like domain superfamily n=1 Tax=Septoria linicola TaxID=215465 RepID=A0A9Q9ANT9_9PEZI|nr:Putative fumarylacetoacetase-like domain superfamily [Septoria linicola]